jgi:hypothetical protein
MVPYLHPDGWQEAQAETSRYAPLRVKCRQESLEEDSRIVAFCQANGHFDIHNLCWLILYTLCEYQVQC